MSRFEGTKVKGEISQLNYNLKNIQKNLKKLLKQQNKIFFFTKTWRYFVYVILGHGQALLLPFVVYLIERTQRLTDTFLI